MTVSRRVLLLALWAVFAAACSDGEERVDPPPVFTPAGDDAESLADAGTTLVPPTPPDPPEIEAPSLAEFTIPCGADAEPTPANGPGVDAGTIRIATGNDEGSRFARGSGESIPEAVVAMAEHCTTLGGLAGRVVTVDAYDAAVTEVVDVAARQCDASFAVVGHGYLQESLGTETWDGCGLPRFSAWIDTLVQPDPVPLMAHRLAAFASETGLEIAIVAPDTTAGRAEAESMEGALRDDGFVVTAVELYPLTVEVDWVALSGRLANTGAGLVHLAGPCRGALVPLLTAGGADGPFVITGPSAYDEACRVEAVSAGLPVEKVLLQVPFLPVEDGAAAPVTEAFVEILARFGASPTGDALLAGAAFWEFAVAADACRDGVLTRSCVEERRLDDWNGAGLYPVGDDASCRVVVGMSAEGFTRVLPAEAGRFGCPDDT